MFCWKKKQATSDKVNKFKQCLILVLDYLAGPSLGRESYIATTSKEIRKQGSLARHCHKYFPSCFGLMNHGAMQRKQRGSWHCGTISYESLLACLIAGNIVQ